MQRSATIGTKEVVLTGGHPSVDGRQNNRKVNQINPENDQLIVQGRRGTPLKIIKLHLAHCTSGNHQVILKT